MKTEQQICEQHLIAHSNQQDDGRFDFRLPNKDGFQATWIF